MKALRFDVFGRDVVVVEREGGWQAYYAGNEGKRRAAADIQIPASITEAEMTQYLDDLCHEWSTDRNRRVRRVD